MGTAILIGAITGMAVLAVLSSLLTKSNPHVPNIEYKEVEVNEDRTDVVLEVDGIGVGFMAVIRHDGTYWISEADLIGTKSKSTAVLRAKRRLLIEWGELE